MNLRDLGDLFVIGFQGTEFTREIQDLMDDLNPSGVILFSRNIETPAQIARLNHDLQAHRLKNSDSGLLVSVDQEGGRVRRLAPPFTVFPSAWEIACSEDPRKSVEEFALITARELRLCGFNLDFTPVLDLVADPGQVSGSVIGDRSYGADVVRVFDLANVVMLTMTRMGVITCCKHFPGHGGTLVDSHHELPVDIRSADLLRLGDLAPFSMAAAARADMMMTAHVLYPELDPEYPATLSSLILDGLLRGEMGYDGVVVTDDLDMGAVAKTRLAPELAVMSVQAGADIVLFCNDPSKAFAAREALFRAVEDGAISETRVSRSRNRISALKARYSNSMKPCDVAAVEDYFRGK